MTEKDPLTRFHSKSYRIASVVASLVVAAGFGSLITLVVVGIATVVRWAF